MNFLPINAADDGFSPVRIEFYEKKVPRLVDASGNKIMAWKID